MDQKLESIKSTSRRQRPSRPRAFTGPQWTISPDGILQLPAFQTPSSLKPDTKLLQVRPTLNSATVEPAQPVPKEKTRSRRTQSAKPKPRKTTTKSCTKSSTPLLASSLQLTSAPFESGKSKSPVKQDSARLPPLGASDDVKPSIEPGPEGRRISKELAIQDVLWETCSDPGVSSSPMQRSPRVKTESDMRQAMWKEDFIASPMLKREISLSPRRLSGPQDYRSPLPSRYHADHDQDSLYSIFSPSLIPDLSINAGSSQNDSSSPEMLKSSPLTKSPQRRFLRSVSSPNILLFTTNDSPFVNKLSPIKSIDDRLNGFSQHNLSPFNASPAMQPYSKRFDRSPGVADGWTPSQKPIKRIRDTIALLGIPKPAPLFQHEDGPPPGELPVHSIAPNELHSSETIELAAKSLLFGDQSTSLGRPPRVSATKPRMRRSLQKTQSVPVLPTLQSITSAPKLELTSTFSEEELRSISAQHFASLDALKTYPTESLQRLSLASPTMDHTFLPLSVLSEDGNVDSSMIQNNRRKSTGKSGDTVYGIPAGMCHVLDGRPGRRLASMKGRAGKS